jgi:hypothetical protein
MAVAGETTAPQGLMGIMQSPIARNMVLMLGAAIVVAIMAAVWMWSQQPEYRVLFSNFSDKRRRCDRRFPATDECAIQVRGRRQRNPCASGPGA